MDDSGEKTEQATDKRMREVRSKGQLSRSQDLTAWVGVGAAAVMIPATVSAGADATAAQFSRIEQIAADPSPQAALRMLGEGLDSMTTILLPMLVVASIAVLGAAALQGGIHFKKFTGKFDQLDLLAGTKRMFGAESLWNGVKAVLKTAVVGIVLLVVIQGLMPVLMSAGGLPASQLISEAGNGVTSLVVAAVGAGLVLAAADALVVMRRNRTRTKMTKQEVKDETKNSDGDPLIRSQRRARQLAMSRNRMMAAIADADVVLVNPIHFAVALKYEPGKSAPRVVAKGAGEVALRIREQAATDGVPVVKDVPLARALHAACELGQEIPADHYTAVARVLAFVQSLSARGAARATAMNMLVPTTGGR